MESLLDGSGAFNSAAAGAGPPVLDRPSHARYQNRRVTVGSYLSLVFENRETLLLQIQ